LPFDAPPTTITARGGTPGEIPETPLLVKFLALGRETSSISEWSMQSAYMTSTDGFQFTVYDENADNLKKLELQPVELIVNGQVQATGRIDRTRRGNNGRSVTCYGRDFVADIVESNVDPLVKIKSGDDLLTAIVTAGGPSGINTVFDDDGAMRNLRTGRKARVKRNKPSKKKRKLSDFKPQPGDGIYEFLNKIMAREGVTIQPGPNRNTLVLASPNYDQDPLYRIARTRDQEDGVHNNLIDGEADRDFSRFPTYVIVQGAHARAGQKGDHAVQVFDLWAISARFNSELGAILQDVTVSGRWLPTKPAANEVLRGALYRLLVFRDDDARNGDQIEKAAKRAIAERLKDTLQYTATLKGHVAPDSGAVYSVDTMIQVDDELADVHEPLWIAERTLRYSSSEGALTDIVAWRPESFEID
jgi:prophage tail gpP-like protein